MRSLLVIASIIFGISVGITLDRVSLPVPPLIAMPIRLVDADMAHLLILQEKPIGATWTRFADLAGNSGITAVRQKSGVWVVPCFEVGKVISGGGK